MKIYTIKTHKNKSKSINNKPTQHQENKQSTNSLLDNRPDTIQQQKLQDIANNSPRTVQTRQLQDYANNSSQIVQRQANKTGLPDNLKTGIENLSGYSMDDVSVHYNSNKPAQLDAHAYAQGTDIHVASGQEKHLSHEAWHVVQQKQGRVKPTLQMGGGVNVNDDVGLEKEADEMGRKAVQRVATNKKTSNLKANTEGLDIVQMVMAYRVQYLYNKKVGGGNPIQAPIDISFEYPDHSEYFLSERNEGQQLGLEVASWEVDDNWYNAVLLYTGKKGKNDGKVRAIIERFKKAGLPKPTKSDGKDCPKFIKERALHFQAAWQSELQKAMRGEVSIRDVQNEKSQQFQEKLKEKHGEGANYDDNVEITNGDYTMFTELSQFKTLWEPEGWQLVKN